METINKLQSDCYFLNLSVRDKKAQVAQLQRDIRALAVELLDPDSDMPRDSLLESRAYLANQRDACADEYAELVRRRAMVRLAIYQSRYPILGWLFKIAFFNRRNNYER